MSLALGAIRPCLEGAVPATIATCASDGTPNVSYVSEVHYVDEQHVALSFQFFNKTRANVLANARATVLLPDPDTGGQYLLALEYLRTDTSGPLFESMKAKLAGIASHTGMSGVFRLLGSDVYRVLDIQRLPGNWSASTALPRPNPLPAVRAASEALAACATLDELVDTTLLALGREFGIAHAMLLMLDGTGGTLYALASRGYADSGVGAEIPLGHGIIGVAAAERAPIRITHMSAEYGYGRAVREAMAQGQAAAELATQIPFPGLDFPGSQLAVPILRGPRLLGVLYVESSRDGAFGYDEEDALVTLASQIAAAICLLQGAAETQPLRPRAAPRSAPATSQPVRVRRYAANDSVFLDEDYLIKGVAGAIFWKLVSEYAATQRTEFTNRELRLDPAIHLPELSENLEARLILLKRRLAERAACVQLEATGRGRFRLKVQQPLVLETVGRSP
jgi:adenylate cyclase